MEAVGDSPLVDASQNLKTDEQREAIEFERNLEDFGKILEQEETCLVKLEEQRVKMVKELEELYQDIKKERDTYRKAIDAVINEQEKVYCDLLSKLPVDSSPIEPSMTIFQACADTTETTKKFDYIKLDIEAIRYDLTEN